MLSKEQKQHYAREGYLVLRSVFTEQELLALDAAADRNPPLDDGKPVGDFPEPGRYTLAKSSWADPAFVHFAEHEAIVGGAKTLLDDDVHLTAYVLYDRTPGGKGLRKHHDYKRWRPVGSSMDWLFTIVPLCDFDEEHGPLCIAPRSHHPERVSDLGEGAMHVHPAMTPADADFIDPVLKRGDLLFMNMHLWHHAADNRSSNHRRGLFNKYAAVHCPPATGHFLYSEAVHGLFSEAGKPLLAVHSDKEIETTRLLLSRKRDGENVFFLVDDGDSLALPGGPVAFEDAIPDWDIGNYIGALDDNIRRQIRLEVPWVSYIGDYEEGDHLCRVYGYPMNDHGFPVPYHEGKWVTLEQLENAPLQYGYECKTVADWLAPSVIRGKGLSQAKCRVDQFAY